jgi:hypothetical protein
MDTLIDSMESALQALATARTSYLAAVDAERHDDAAHAQFLSNMGLSIDPEPASAPALIRGRQSDLDAKVGGRVLDVALRSRLLALGLDAMVRSACATGPVPATWADDFKASVDAHVLGA